jgi:hypothetical protein
MESKSQPPIGCKPPREQELRLPLPNRGKPRVHSTRDSQCLSANFFVIQSAGAGRLQSSTVYVRLTAEFESSKVALTSPHKFLLGRFYHDKCHGSGTARRSNVGPHPHYKGWSAEFRTIIHRHNMSTYQSHSENTIVKSPRFEMFQLTAS